MKKLSIFIPSVICLLLFLAQPVFAQDASSSASVAATSTPSASSTASPTATPTPSPSATSTPKASTSPTKTPTPTAKASAQPSAASGSPEIYSKTIDDLKPDNQPLPAFAFGLTGNSGSSSQSGKGLPIFDILGLLLLIIIAVVIMKKMRKKNHGPWKSASS